MRAAGKSDVIEFFDYGRGRCDLYGQRNSAGAVEALIRPYCSVSDDPIEPLSFVLTAEKYGYGAKLDLWVAGKLMAFVRARRSDGLNLQVGMNVTPSSIGNPNDLIETLEFAVTFEVPEHLPWPASNPTLLQFVSKVRSAGHRVALDDVSEAPDMLERWQAVGDMIDVVKLDLGRGTLLGSEVRNNPERMGPVLIQACKLLREAVNSGKQVVLERGDDGASAVFSKIATYIVGSEFTFIRQDFAIHRPEPLEGMTT